MVKFWPSELLTCAFCTTFSFRAICMPVHNFSPHDQEHLKRQDLDHMERARVHRVVCADALFRTSTEHLDVPGLKLISCVKGWNSFGGLSSSRGDEQTSLQNPEILMNYAYPQWPQFVTCYFGQAAMWFYFLAYTGDRVVQSHILGGLCS